MRGGLTIAKPRGACTGRSSIAKTCRECTGRAPWACGLCVVCGTRGACRGVWGVRCLGRILGFRVSKQLAIAITGWRCTGKFSTITGNMRQMLGNRKRSREMQRQKLYRKGLQEMRRQRLHVRVRRGVWDVWSVSGRVGSALLGTYFRV